MAAVAGSWMSGFLKSFGVILASEIGDKTFIIAAVMAMKHSRRWVFLGAAAALALMTVLSAMLGWAAPNLLPKAYTHYAATVLFFCFGVRLLYDTILNKAEAVSDEIEEVERELADSEAQRRPQAAAGAEDPKGTAKHKGMGRVVRRLLPPVFLEIFTLTFLAEWGDRSQISTIGLAFDYEVSAVSLGGILGHALCTGAAVIGGRHLASHIDERMVSMFGGVLFLCFGFHSLWEGIPA